MVIIEFFNSDKVVEYNVDTHQKLIRDIKYDNRKTLFSLIDMNNKIVYHSLSSNYVKGPLEDKYFIIKLNYPYDFIMDIYNFDECNDIDHCKSLIEKIKILLNDKNKDYINDKKLIIFILRYIKNNDNIYLINILMIYIMKLKSYYQII